MWSPQAPAWAKAALLNGGTTRHRARFLPFFFSDAGLGFLLGAYWAATTHTTAVILALVHVCSPAQDLRLLCNDSILFAKGWAVYCWV